MADPSSNDDSNSFGGMPMPVTDRSDPNWNWNYDYLNPYGKYIASLSDQMPGLLSDQSINGSPLLYTDPQAYFTMRDAAKGLAGVGAQISEIGPPSDG